MMYGSRDMEHDETEFFVILGCFLPFYPNPKKNKLLTKWKKTTCRYYHFTQVYHTQQSYNEWFLGYQAQQTAFFVILDHFGPFVIFCHFGPKKPKFWKTEKSRGDIIILHMCNKNNDPMLYYSLDMEHNGCNCYFSFWAIFDHLPP